MGLRTFSVRGGSRQPSNIDEELYNNNIDIGNSPSFPGGEYGGGVLYPDPNRSQIPSGVVNTDPLNLEGDIHSADKPASAPAASGVKPAPVKGIEEDSPYPLDPAKANTDRNARIAAAGIDAIGGVINAISRHQDFVNLNNMKIMQASRQQEYIQQDAARSILREGTKAQDRKGDAQLNAAAQGQSANGDLAKTAMSAEDVYAAQNALNIEIKAMRGIYGLAVEKNAMETNNRISAINRNASIAQNIISFGAKTAAARS